MAIAPNFFSIVIFPLEKGIKIPSAFMTSYGGELRKKVLLNVANGRSWQVELVDCDNGTWLKKGWQQFAESYSIKKFYFLLFKYEGNSRFHVHIFDLSASEIEYPFEANTSNDQIDNDEESVQILSSIPTNQCSKRKIKPQTDHMDEALQEDDEISVVILDDDDEDDDVVQVMCSRRMTRSSRRKMLESNQIQEPKLEKMDEVEISENQGRKRRQGYSLVHKEGSISYRKAKAFSSTKPFFIYFMQPSSVFHRCSLSIPNSFVRKYLPNRKQSNLVLRVPGLQQTWTVTCNRNINANITTGWRRFVEDNNLRLKDSCVFELENYPNLFNVIIYRNVKHM